MAEPSICKKNILPPFDASSIVYTFWPPGGASCTDCKFGHQEAPLAPVASVAQLALDTRLHHSHCHIALPFWHYQLVLSWYLHKPESHQLSLQNILDGWTDIRTQRSDPRFTWGCVRYFIKKQPIWKHQNNFNKFQLNCVACIEHAIMPLLTIWTIFGWPLL